VGTQSFTYTFQRFGESSQVRICCYRWRTFCIAFLWSVFWIIVPLKIFESTWGNGFFGLLFLLFGVFLSFMGILTAGETLLTRTLTLCPPTELRIRTSFFGVSKTRLVKLSDVTSFGFGLFGHSLDPVLRLDLQHPRKGNEWVVLAYKPTKQEVDAFLNDIEAKGFQLPRSS
jgi:hypothetical protein